MRSNKKMYNDMLCEIKKHMDEPTFAMSNQLIETSLRLVIHNISVKYKDASDAEFDMILNKIRGNLANFVALVILQLKAFGEGENTGPFIELCEQLLKINNEQYN